MQNFIDNASNISVIAGAARIKSNNLINGCLIDPTNILATDAARIVSRHFTANGNRGLFSQDDINVYLAASSLLHTLDAWVYLSHSVGSLLKGDPGISIHLAYYAELRASMSFLASEGIGIFSGVHLNVDSQNNTNQDPLPYRNGRKSGWGTHKMVWEAIEKWSTSTVKPTTPDILKVFSVNGKGFDKWALAFPNSSVLTGNGVIKQWLTNWNLDVNNFKSDRDDRNIVSYRPQRTSIITAKHSVNEIIDELSSYWNLMEPSQSSRFQVLDRHLLKMFLQKLYTQLSPAIKATLTLEEAIKSTFDVLGESHNQSFIDFLKDTSTSHKIFLEAQEIAIDPTTGSINALAVIARATLMLRISTGSTSVIFKEAGISMQDLDRLWDQYGIDSGLWSSGNAPQDFIELWDDIQDHIQDIDDWAEIRKPDLSLFHIYEDASIPLSFNYYKQFNRAGLWGLAI
tara:strand:+ start:4924 stop:6294 length:1371 start_codon:yes stop_codon:yes gene_type:complete